MPTLTELEPRWVEWEGQRVGFTFLCPHCRTTRLFCKSVPMAMRDQCEIFARDFPDNGGEIVPAKQEYAWSITGDFETMSVTPSIDASASGHWHGHVVDGNAN